MSSLSRIISVISGGLSLRCGRAATGGKSDGIEPWAVLAHDRRRADALVKRIQRLLANLDGSRHGPGAFHQMRQSERRHDEAGLVEARQPPRLHDRADLRDALVEAELLHRGHQLQIEGAVATV